MSNPTRKLKRHLTSKGNTGWSPSMQQRRGGTRISKGTPHGRYVSVTIRDTQDGPEVGSLHVSKRRPMSWMPLPALMAQRGLIR